MTDSRDAIISRPNKRMTAVIFAAVQQTAQYNKTGVFDSYKDTCDFSYTTSLFAPPVMDGTEK